ncbi:hypothetical protein NEUTE2DRAFT_59611, partial [Neurospora tetrasperma FGSC 2509]
LIRFLTNPGPVYYLVVKRIKVYLYSTNYYTLQLKEGNKFKIYINISFINNTNDRRSL